VVISDNGAIEWRNNPGDVAPLEIRHALVLGANVALRVPFEPQSKDVSQVTLMTYATLSGSFANISTPSGWFVTVGPTAAVLSRTLQPVSTSSASTKPPLTAGPALPSRLGLILGLSLGGGVLVAVIVVVIACCVRVRRSREKRRFLRDDEIVSGEQEKLIQQPV
jgi:hypothetical protein